MAAGSYHRSTELLSRQDSGLVVIDMQDRLLQLISGHERIRWNVDRLLDGANILAVPIVATAQNPEKLGPFAPELAANRVVVHSKMAFSCCQEGDIFQPFVERRIDKIVLAGIESHVCVLQTALDLLGEGFRVFVVADAVGSRSEFDRDIALRRLDSAGVILTTTESVLFEWCERAGTDEFRKISSIVRTRSP